MNTQPLIEQLEKILSDFSALAANSKHNDLSDLPKHERQALVTRAVTAVHRIAGRSSTYSAEIERLFATMPSISHHVTSIVGVVAALLSDVKDGHLQSLIDLVQADTFADFLDMSQHLHDAGYKDAAAVIAGSTLESHLRGLCVKFNIPTEVTKADDSVTAKKTESMNSDLAAVSVYSKLDQKSITAWLDLRNKAAHGKFTEYQTEQVSLMLAGIRDFISRTSSWRPQ